MTKEELIKMYSPYIKDIHPAGYSLIGKCSFHRERTGSFVLNFNLGYYHCFGCGKGGQLSELMNDIKTYEKPTR